MAERPTRRAVTAIWLTAVLGAGCTPQPPAPEVVRPVLTRLVGAGEATAIRVYPGEIRARHEHDLAFRIGGKIVARHVEVGARVRAGSVLASIDPQDARLAVAAARSAVSAAEAEHALARAELERTRALHEKRFLSAAALDARQSAFDASQARLDQARAQLATAGNQTSYTALIAERDGVILAAAAEPGQVISAGQAVFRFARDGEKEVLIHLPERDLPGLRGAAAPTVRVWALPGPTFTGRVREIAPAADPASRTYPARITLLGADQGVQLGMSAEVRFSPPTDPERRSTVRLPLGALFHRDGKPAVWVVENGTVRLAPVTTGDFAGDTIEIGSGLSPGQRVVTAGAQLLSPGQKVRVLDDTRGQSR